MDLILKERMKERKEIKERKIMERKKERKKEAEVKERKKERKKIEIILK